MSPPLRLASARHLPRGRGRGGGGEGDQRQRSSRLGELPPKAAEGGTRRTLSRDDALQLIEHADLDGLLSAASRLRDRGKGRIVTYSKKVFIPLTHLCRDYCGYCTFRADPVPGVAAYMTPDEVLAVAEAGARAGCKEALFWLGDQPERIFPEARESLRQARLRAHARLSRRDDRAGAEEDRPLAARQSRRDGRRRSRPLAPSRMSASG